MKRRTMFAHLIACSVFLIQTPHGANAQISCYFKASPECKFMALCKTDNLKREQEAREKVAKGLPYGGTGLKCECFWEQVQSGFPETEFSSVVTLLEAIQKEDSTRINMIEAKAGPLFKNRMVAVIQASNVKCNYKISAGK